MNPPCGCTWIQSFRRTRFHPRLTPLGSAASGIWDSERERRAQRCFPAATWRGAVRRTGLAGAVEPNPSSRRTPHAAASCLLAGPGHWARMCSALTQHESYADCTCTSRNAQARSEELSVRPLFLDCLALTAYPSLWVDYAC